ncbi:MAG: DUF1328 domain-containing protein [Chloroflexota bacterium]
MAALLTWAIVALVIAVIAGIIGYSGAGSQPARVGRRLFSVFVTISIVLALLVILGIGLLL